MILYTIIKNNASPILNHEITERTAYLCCTLLIIYGMQYSPDTTTVSL